MSSAKSLPEENVVRRGTQPFKVPIGLLQIKPGLNIRQDYGSMEELGWRTFNSTDSFHNIPLVGFREEGNFVVVHGHSRRLGLVYVAEHKEAMLTQFKKDLPEELSKADKAALVDAKREYLESLLSSVPFIVEPQGVTAGQRIIDMVTTNSGRPLSPLELADAVKRLFDEKMGDKEIAKALSLSPAYIGKLMTLNASPPEFIKLIKDGVISSTFAIEIATGGGIPDFMVKHKKGEFVKVKMEGEVNTNGSQVKPDGPPVKITKKDYQPKGPDSVKFFTKFAKTADREKMNEHQKAAFDFMVKVTTNDAAIDDFFTFFGQK